MSKHTHYPAESAPVAGKQAKKKKPQGSGLLGRIVRRFFLVLLTLVVVILVAVSLAANLIFNGPSPAARDLLTMTLLEPSATKWIPGLFMDEATLNSIRYGDSSSSTIDDFTDTTKVIINKDTNIAATSDEWADSPDGIQISSYAGDTFNAHIMLIRDPSKVYLATSTERFSSSIPGTRIDDQIETEGAIAAINAGAFFDNGTTSATVGATPEGLVVSKGSVKWTTGSPPNASGFAGFNGEDILVVSKENLTQAQSESLGIRDGCCFGPALIINGEVNQDVYNTASGLNPRTAIGQRADGAVIFLCIDGRQAGSMGGTYKDVIDIMIEYGAVNACNMDGGSSSVMLYRDTYGLFGEAGQVQKINSYSLLQERPRRMPTFWMVAA